MAEPLIKTPEEVQLMRESGRLLAQVFAMLDGFIRDGVTTMDINDRAEEFIVEQLNARPASKGQYGYQFALNTSVNDVVCHGMPSSSYRLKKRDIINIDITLEKNGYIADSSNVHRRRRGRAGATLG